jgi:hypothetical protein
MCGISRQQALLLAILLFLAIIILGCLCMLTIENPVLGTTPFVF